MKKLIDKQTVIDMLCSQCTVDKPETCSTIRYGDKWCNEVYMILNAPTIDAAPIKHGRWIERESGTEDKENGFETVIVCSRCDFPATTFYSEDCESRTQIRTDFCPTCGAKMDGTDGNLYAKEENDERSSREVNA